MTDFKTYTEFCKTTESLPDSVEVNIADLRMAMNIVAKGNQLLDIIKKNAFYGKPFNRQTWQNIIASLNQDIAAGSEMSRKAMSHKVPTQALDFDVRTAHAIIGMNTEAGELIENMSAAIFDDKEFDAANFGEEVGDLMWYTAVGLDATNQDFDKCLATNQAKLEARYSEGKFTQDAAINRDLQVEREILEDGIETQPEVVEKPVQPEVVEAVVIEPAQTPDTPKSSKKSTSKSK